MKKQKAAPTLIDTLYRTSFSNEPVRGWTSNAKWRDALRRAKRFVARRRDVGLPRRAWHARFRQPSVPTASAGHQEEPHPRRRAPAHGRAVAVRDDMDRVQPAQVPGTRQAAAGPRRRLLKACPSARAGCCSGTRTLETAFMRSHRLARSRRVWPTSDGFRHVDLPGRAGLDRRHGHRCCRGGSLPFGTKGATPSEVSTGLIGYKTDRASLVFIADDHTPNKPERDVAELLREWAGVQRRMWALLATINDLPVQMTEVRATKGFVAKGAVPQVPRPQDHHPDGAEEALPQDHPRRARHRASSGRAGARALAQRLAASAVGAVRARVGRRRDAHVLHPCQGTQDLGRSSTCVAIPRGASSPGTIVVTHEPEPTSMETRRFTTSTRLITAQPGSCSCSRAAGTSR